MNKSTYTLIILMQLSVQLAFGNINYIDFNKIPNHKKYNAEYLFVKDNQEYYNHWIPKWKYDKNENELINRLKEAYTSFDSISTVNTELLLLKADIAHYLYNLDISNFSDSALNYYQQAIKNSPDDYRGYWFLAYHYAQSNMPINSVELFLKAEKMKPNNKPVDFWEEYAKATAVANMPTHALYGMDKTRAILGKAGNVENQLGESIFKQIVDLNRDNNYKQEDVWRVTNGDNTAYVNRPLGIKISVDSTWKVSMYDYINHNCGFVIEPPTIKNKKGKEISYRIAITMRVANDSDRLEKYLGNIISVYRTKSKIRFSDKYDKMIAYEIKEKEMYKDMGGGHLYAIAIERNMPAYPGLLLENPFLLPVFEPGKVNYFSIIGSKNRFKGKIFYSILLDSCEDINEQSFTLFKSLFYNQIVIE